MNSNGHVTRVVGRPILVLGDVGGFRNEAVLPHCKINAVAEAFFKATLGDKRVRLRNLYDSSSTKVLRNIHCP